MVLGLVVQKQKFHIVEGLSLMPGFRCLTKKNVNFFSYFIYLWAGNDLLTEKSFASIKQVLFITALVRTKIHLRIKED